MQEFAIHVFYPDGGAPESGVQTPEQLSDKWLTLCSTLINKSGPVMSRNMGGTLSHFDVEMAGPIGQLLVLGHRCFYFAISRGTNSNQDQTAITHFRSIAENVIQTVGNRVTESASSVLTDAVEFPCLLLLDTCQAEVVDDQKSALAQLGIHLAAAYFQYCKSTTEVD